MMMMMKRAQLLLLLLTATLSHAQRFDCGENYCVDRPSFRIQALTHARANIPWWDRMRSAMTQASRDFNVQLDMPLQLVSETDDSTELAREIRTRALLPSSNDLPDALIVTIPDETVRGRRRRRSPCRHGTCLWF